MEKRDRVSYQMRAAHWMIMNKRQRITWTVWSFVNYFDKANMVKDRRNVSISMLAHNLVSHSA